MTEEKKNLSRRDFLKVSGLVGGAALAGCAPIVVEQQPAQQPAAEEKAEAPAVVGKPFDGVTVRMHAISGANYDELYKIIPEWEEETGAKVEFVFKGNGFETDKRLVQDFAAGTVDYDVCWDHTSFFSQYVKADGLEPLDDYFSEEELSDFIPALLDAGRRDGKLWIIPRHYDISCNHYLTDLVEMLQEGLCSLGIAHEIANLRISAVLSPQLLHEKRIVQKADIEHDVGFPGQTVLETEGEKGKEHRFAGA